MKHHHLSWFSDLLTLLFFIVSTAKPTHPPTPQPSEEDAIDVPLPPSGTLGRVANDGSPSSLYPLDRCLGDCDSDSDCMDNLKCCQRDSSSDPPPPNCLGNTEGDTDYCYSPADGSCNDDNGSGTETPSTSVPAPPTATSVPSGVYILL